MKGATDYEDQGDLKNPVNQVVAILPQELDVERLVADLHKAGFASEDIGILSGGKDAHKLDAAMESPPIVPPEVPIPPEQPPLPVPTEPIPGPVPTRPTPIPPPPEPIPPNTPEPNQPSRPAGVG